MCNTSATSWADIDDHIVNKRVIESITAIRAMQQVGIHEAIDLLRERYLMLRKERPTDFVCDDAAYWDGFYS